jgi:hypothetical protein
MAMWTVEIRRRCMPLRAPLPADEVPRLRLLMASVVKDTHRGGIRPATWSRAISS